MTLTYQKVAVNGLEISRTKGDDVMQKRDRDVLLNMYAYAQIYLTNRIDTTGIDSHREEYEKELREIKELCLRLMNEVVI